MSTGDFGPLRFTGERIVPGDPALNYTFMRHLAVYDLFARRVSGKTVLDVGCGEGYGAAFLSRHAALVVGLDASAETLAHAQQKYGGPRLRFHRGSAAALPYRDQSFDCACTFQVIEHVSDSERMVAEVYRVLNPGGLFCVSTPNKSTFTPTGEILDPFHVREFTGGELEALLKQRFPSVQVLGLWGNEAVQKLYGIDQEQIKRSLRLDPLRLRRLLPLWLLQRLYTRRLTATRRAIWRKHRDLVERLTTADFSFVEAPLEVERAMDLIALCRK